MMHSRLTAKKIFTFVALGTVILSLTGCFGGKDTLPTDGNLPVVTGDGLTETALPDDQPYQYLNKEKGFSVTLPAKWTFQENVFNALVMFFAPQAEGDKVKENLGVTTTKLTGDVDLASFVELSKGIVEGRTKDFKIEKEEAITINGNNAMKIIYKGTNGENKLERQQVIFLQGTTAYELTYTATEDTFNDLLDEVDAIINTFSFNQ